MTNRDIVTRFGSWCQFTAVHGPVVVGRVVIGANDQPNHRCGNPQARQEPTPEILGGLEKLDDIIGGQSEILIYVHGYNNSFEDTIFDALKFAKMVNYNGTVVVFFLTAEGIQPEAPLMYCNAFVAAMVLSDDFKQTLEKITGDHVVDVIAHSMGTVVVTRGFRSVGDRIDNLVAIAGDEERDVFGNTVASLGSALPGRISVYASSDDSVLKLGQLWGRRCVPPHVGARIGRAGNDLIDIPSVDGIDATVASEESFDVHSYLFGSRTLQEDFIELLTKNVEAAKRAHILAAIPRPSTRKTDYFNLIQPMYVHQ